MKVSILVPVYGVEKYIEQCAHSLMEQTYDDMEYVFVDDCSPDDSIAILKRVVAQYPQRSGQVRIIHHDHNRGIGATRDTALTAATGECFIYVDSDDYVDKRCVELLVKRMEETGAQMVDGGYAISRDNMVTQTTPPYGGSRHSYVCRLLCQNLLHNRIWGRLINRRAMLDNNLRTIEGIDYSEDFMVATRLVAALTRAGVEKTLYYYRDDNSGSYTNTLSPRHHRSYLRSCAIVLDFFGRIEEYRTATDFCRLAVIRHARRFGVDFSEVEELCPDAFKTGHGYATLIANLLRAPRVPYSITCFIYRFARRLFLFSL